MQLYDYLPRTVLCIGAHADDIDCHAGGSVAGWIAAGAQVYYHILTGGTLGALDHTIPRGRLQSVREEEQLAAAKVHGVKQVFFAGLQDGSLSLNRELKKEIVRVIRLVRPDLVVGWDPNFYYSAQHGVINHSDHLAAGLATLAAVNHLADNPRVFPSLTGPDRRILDPHQVDRALLMTLDPNPAYVIDTSHVADLKRKAMQAHSSQLTDSFIERVAGWDAATGRAARLASAERFNGVEVIR